MLVAIYARITEKEDREKLSKQIAECQQYAREQGYKTRESFIYEDIAPDNLDPAFHPDKYPDLHRLVKDARAHRFTIVVVKTYLSFCLDTGDLKKLATTLAYANVHIETILPLDQFANPPVSIHPIPRNAPQHLIDTMCWK